MEALAAVDTIVFDKTGTLTKAAPVLLRIIPYNGYHNNEVLKIAACLEEHFPHPVAKAVVKAALPPAELMAMGKRELEQLGIHLELPPPFNHEPYQPHERKRKFGVPIFPSSFSW